MDISLNNVRKATDNLNKKKALTTLADTATVKKPKDNKSTGFRIVCAN
jgi:hypothetical protein